MMALSRKGTTFVVAAAGALLIACGGTKGGGAGGGAKLNPACSASNSCGGDLTGTWKTAGVCGVTTPSLLAELCPQIAIDTGGLTITGTLGFQSSDMAYALTATLSGSLAAAVPASCLTNTGTTCDELSADIDDVVGPTLTATCTSASDGCDCTVTVPSLPLMASGAYATTGSMLTVTPAGGTAATGTYCATDSTLAASVPVDLGSIFGEAPVAFVLTK
jgi:hypothetical protein